MKDLFRCYVNRVASTECVDIAHHHPREAAVEATRQFSFAPGDYEVMVYQWDGRDWGLVGTWEITRSIKPTYHAREVG